MTSWIALHPEILAQRRTRPVTAPVSASTAVWKAVKSLSPKTHALVDALATAL
jgi:hypothetical protein